MTNICMLSTGHGPLDDRIYYKEIMSLVRRYPAIVVVTPEEAPDTKDIIDGVRFVSLKNRGSKLSRLLAIPNAIKYVININPHVCHFHDFELIFAMPFIRLFTKCKIIYDVHEVYPEMVYDSKKIPTILRPLLSKLADLTEKKLSQLADYIIASDDNISERFVNSHKNVATIFNYPRLTIFVPDESKLIELKERYKGRTPIIYQGGMSEERGLFHMVKAMEVLKKKRPDIILLLVGNMTDDILKRVKKEIRDKELDNHIDLVKWVPHKEVVNYISISKVGLVPLLPTKKFLKNIPLKQFEYMACGIPVLGANLPPITSYINASGCGKSFDSTNSEAMASGVIDILQNKSDWERMSDAGKKAIQNLWNWDKMEKELFVVYDKLLGNT